MGVRRLCEGWENWSSGSEVSGLMVFLRTGAGSDAKRELELQEQGHFNEGSLLRAPPLRTCLPCGTKESLEAWTGRVH